MGMQKTIKKRNKMRKISGFDDTMCPFFQFSQRSTNFRPQKIR